MDLKLLGIYLNDHLAGSRMALEAAQRSERENRGNPVGDYLAAFIAELEADRSALTELMRELGVARDPLKEGAAWVAERVGRLKLNGRLLRYSPLSRLVELEGLCIGVEGKLSMWRALRRLAATEPRLQAFDFEALIARAEAQRTALERLRLQAAGAAFAERVVPVGQTPSPVGRK
jgi:hypothetical protein